MKSEVFNVDCLEFMKQYPDNHWELAIVDPPYGIGDCRQTLSKKHHKKIKWNDDIPTNDYFRELIRVSENQIIWGVNYYPNYIKSVGRIVHDKTGGGKRKQLKELSDADIASHSFGVNIKIFHYLWQGNVQGNTINWKNEGIDARIHPTQKPIALYKWLLQNYAKEGDKILDTHGGSFSSRIAAYDMGFDFTGIELDKEYFDQAEFRFQEHIKQKVFDFGGNFIQTE